MHIERPVTSFPSNHRDQVNDIALNFLGNRLATCSSDGFIHIQDVSEQTPRHLATISGHSQPVLRMSWSPNGLLASVGTSGLLMVHQESSDNPAVYELIYKFDHQSPVTGVSFFQNPLPNQPCLVATCCEDASIHIFQQSGDDFHHRKYQSHSSPCTCISFHDSVHLLASGSKNGEIIIWMEKDDAFKPAFQLSTHSSSIVDLSFAPSHSIPSTRILASCSVDGTVLVFSGDDSGFNHEEVTTEAVGVSRVGWSESGVALFVMSTVPTVWSRVGGFWQSLGQLSVRPEMATSQVPRFGSSGGVI
ncbi:hypothetical protein RCL1_006135 [Eukaryota sp. TZLM3-RCL]